MVKGGAKLLRAKTWTLAQILMPFSMKRLRAESLPIDSNFLALWFRGNFKMFTQVVFNNPFS